MKFVRFMYHYKPYLMLYFAAGTFIYLVVDWLLLRRGVLQSGVVWQIFGLSAWFAATQMACYFGREESPSKGRILCHMLLNLGGVAATAAGFHWFSFHWKNWLLFLGIFLALYAAIYWAFWLYDWVLSQELNEKLAQYHARAGQGERES